MSSDQERWDERYRSALEAGGGEREPASLLLAHAGVLVGQERGPALDVAAGLGRNSVHLARLGFAVDAVDVSAVAVEHLRRIAQRDRLPLQARRLDLTVDSLPATGHQVVVNTFFLDRRLFGALARALLPGGLLLFETFLPDRSATYGPQDPSRVLEPGELRRAFAALDVLHYAEGRAEPGARPTARLVARRPSTA